jgi:UDP-N-acetylmuramoyl-L-alanyl-D-glutamate--2,6-diaminopimelate ligase
VAVVNVDDPFGRELAEALVGNATEVLTVSARTPASVRLRRLEVDPGGMSVSAHTPAGEVELRAPLIGRHNALNVLTTIATVAALDLDVKLAASAFASAPQVPGRLELCSAAPHDDIVAVVDYAHTPDALARVLESLREVCSGRLHCVFGCGGDRDPAKRGPMGAAVAQHADVAIVTNDNPRSEDPAHIAAAVVAGVRATSPSMELHVELDRARAIQTVVTSAAPGDVVVVAGKGHETYQIFADRVIDFDDRVELGRALASRRGMAGAH